mmetsp:Transcript_19936/g.50566  ORF Transcript_19936/g.50566 Transcript_19936/m.50566 type:complete len:293 (-) Transcript_19936:484-1362(-)
MLPFMTPFTRVMTERMISSGLASSGMAPSVSSMASACTAIRCIVPPSWSVSTWRTSMAAVCAMLSGPAAPGGMARSIWLRRMPTVPATLLAMLVTMGTIICSMPGKLEPPSRPSSSPERAPCPSTAARGAEPAPAPAAALPGWREAEAVLGRAPVPACAPAPPAGAAPVRPDIICEIRGPSCARSDMSFSSRVTWLAPPAPGTPSTAACTTGACPPAAPAPPAAAAPAPARAPAPAAAPAPAPAAAAPSPPAGTGPMATPGMPKLNKPSSPPMAPTPPMPPMAPIPPMPIPK